MVARVITGSKHEIAQKVASLDGEVREAIVFIDEPAGASTEGVPATAEELFKEMEPYMAHVGNVDYSREAIYSKKSGE
jgi:hypothetical protein